MTKAEYADYQETMREFFSHGLCNLSTVSDENGTIEPYFSWRPCEVCRSHLGGDRYDCNGFNEQTGEIEEYSACQDCVYYAEYCRLDDMTMWEIEHSPV
jgi:hypothetical protein